VSDDTRWTVDAWEDDRTGRCPFAAWFGKLNEYEQAVVDAVIENIVAPLGMNICDTECCRRFGRGESQPVVLSQQPRGNVQSSCDCS